MAFNLTAQLNLQGPANVKQIAAQIRKDLGNVNATVKFKLDPSVTRNVGALSSAVKGLNSAFMATTTSANAASAAIKGFGNAINSVKINNIPQQINAAATAANRLNKVAAASAKDIGSASAEMQEFGKQAGLAVRRFVAFSTVTSVIYGVTNSINEGVQAFIDYDKELVKLQQVTGESLSGLSKLQAQITSLSTSYGVSSKELTSVASTLAQAGLTARETEKALKALALSSLAPSFDDMNETVEGSIALMRQFGISADELEAALGSVNTVAARFAVESADIITAVQRTGSVFATASKGVSEGKDALNEFIAVFTSIRATTRESAETIATGLRTIFTRIQRGTTIDALKEFGVNLTDAEGKFVGAYKAVELLSKGLSSIDSRSLDFSKIVEELGGFRQIGKVIPLIQQFSVAQEALKVAQSGQGSLAKDAATAQLSLANQISKVRQEFFALFREIGQSKGFQSLIRGTLTLTSGLIKVTDAIKGILPALAVLAAFKGVKALTQFASGFGTGLKRGPDGKSQGGVIKKFARGGFVPGVGSGDTVPAMLEPGEFVLRKKAAETIGADKLHAMNSYGSGGIIRGKSGSGLGNKRQRFAKGGAVLASIDGDFETIDGDTFSAKVTPKTDQFKAKFRVNEFDTYEITKDSYVSKAKAEKIMSLNPNKRGLKEVGANKYLVKKDYIVTDKDSLTAQEAAYDAKDRLASQVESFIGSQAANNTVPNAGGFGRYLAKTNFKMPEDLTTGRKWDKDGKEFNKGGIVQKFAGGGQVLRKIGIIDSDVLRDEANETKVKKAMEKLGIKDVREYSLKLSELALEARKNQDLDKFISIAGAAGSGKSSLATGIGANDNATLRKTTRFPVLTPDDIKKANQIIALTSTASKTKFDSYLKNVDRAYVLSSNTTEEQELIQKNRENRDVTGQGLYGRKPGSTRGATRDFGADEAYIRDELGDKAVVLGRQSGGYRLRRKKADELSEIVQARGYYTGGFAPATKGHAGAVESLLERMIEENPDSSIKDILINAAGNLPMISKEGMDHAARYGILDSDLRLLMAKINFSGAMLAQGNSKTGEIPPFLEVLGEPGSRRKFAKVQGALAVTSGKDESTLGKYARAGIKVKDIPRIDDISATKVRTALRDGDDKLLSELVHPEIASILMGNRPQLRNRGVMVPMLLEKLHDVTKVEEERYDAQIKEILANVPGGPYKVLSKNVKDNYPEIAEQVLSLRAQKKKMMEGAFGYKAYNIIQELSSKYPDMYGIDTNRRSSVSIAPNDVASDIMASHVSSSISNIFGTGIPESVPTGLQEAILKRVQKETSVDKTSGILPAKANEILKRFGSIVLPKDSQFGMFAGKTVESTSKAGKLPYWQSTFSHLMMKPEKELAYISARDYLIQKFNESQGEKQTSTLEKTTKAILQSEQLGLVGLNPLGHTNVLGPFDWNLGQDQNGKDVSINASIIERGLPTQYQSVIDFLSGETEKLVGGAAKLLGIEAKKLTKKQRETLGQGNIEGALLEQIFGSADATILDDALRTRPIDFPMGIGPKAAKIFGIDPNMPTEVKRTIDSGSRSKAIEEFQRYFRQINEVPEPQKFADGGAVYSPEQLVSLAKYRTGSQIDGKTNSEYINRYLENKKSFMSWLESVDGDPKGSFQSTEEAANNLLEMFKQKESLQGSSRSDKLFSTLKGGKLKNVLTQIGTPLNSNKDIADAIDKTFNLNGSLLSTSESLETANMFQTDSGSSATMSIYRKKGSASIDVDKSVFDIALDEDILQNLSKYIDPASGKSGEEILSKARSAIRMEREFILPPDSKFRILDIDGIYTKPQEDKLLGGDIRHIEGMKVQQFAKGGSVEDTVPALLTPGEFVINKKAAQRIGYGKLQEYNKADKIQGYNKGGIVGSSIVQRFASGGDVLSFGALMKALSSFSQSPVQKLDSRPDTISSSTLKTSSEFFNNVKLISRAFTEAGYSMKSFSDILDQVANGADISYKDIEKAITKDVERLKITGASIDTIIEAEKALKNIRDESKTVVVKRQFLESGFRESKKGQVLGSGASQQAILTEADNIEKSIRAQREKQLTQSLSGGPGGYGPSFGTADQIKEEVKRRLDEQTREIKEMSFTSATQKVTGIKKTELADMNISGSDIQKYIAQSMTDRKTLSQMDKQLIQLRMEEYKNAGTVRGESVKSASEALSLAKEEAAKRREIINEIAKQEGIKGVGAGGFTDWRNSPVKKVVQERYFSGTMSQGIGTALGDVGLLAGLAGGQGQNIANLMYNTTNDSGKIAAAGTSAAIQQSGSTLAAGLTTASQLMAINPMLGAAAAIGTALYAATDAVLDFSGTQKTATLEMEKSLRFEEVANAEKDLAKAFKDFEKDINNIDLQKALDSALIRTSETTLRANASDTKVAENAKANTRTWPEFFLGAEKPKMDTADVNELVRAQAERASANADKGFALISQRINQGASLETIQSDKDLAGAREALTLADEDALKTIRARIIAEGGYGKVSEVRQREILSEVASERTATDAQIKAAIESKKLSDSMEASNKAGRRLAMSFEILSNVVGDSINRIKFESDSRIEAAKQSRAALRGQSEDSGPRLKELDILSNPNSYSDDEFNKALQTTTANLDAKTRDQIIGGSQLQQLLPKAITQSIASQLSTNASLDPATAKADVIKAVNEQIDKTNLSAEEKANLKENARGRIENLAAKADKENDTPQAELQAFRESLEDSKNIIDDFGSKALEQAKALASFKQGALAEFSDALKDASKAAKDAQNYFKKSRDIGVQGNLNLREVMTGVGETYDERKNRTMGDVASLTGGLTSPAAIKNKIVDLEAQRTAEDERRATLTDPQQLADSAKQLRSLDDQLRDTREGLDELANSTELVEKAFNDLKNVRDLQKNRESFINTLLTNTPEEAEKLNKTFIRLQRNLSGGLNSAGNQRDARKEFNKTLRETGSVRAATRAGNTVLANQRKDTLALMQDSGFRASQELMIRNKYANTGVNTDQVVADYFKNQESQMMKSMAIESGLINNLLVRQAIAAKENPNVDQATKEAANKYLQAVGLQAEATKEQGQLALLESQKALTFANDNLKQSIDNLTKAITNGMVNNDVPKGFAPIPAVAAPVAPGNARGGLIYASKGQLVNFQPQGTDTVPAMLTPGEFVINAKSTAEHLPLLKAINSGNYSRGGVVYLANGGEAESRVDSIPMPPITRVAWGRGSAIKVGKPKNVQNERMFEVEGLRPTEDDALLVPSRVNNVDNPLNVRLPLMPKPGSVPITINSGGALILPSNSEESQNQTISASPGLLSSIQTAGSSNDARAKAEAERAITSTKIGIEKRANIAAQEAGFDSEFDRLLESGAWRDDEGNRELYKKQRRTQVINQRNQAKLDEQTNKIDAKFNQLLTEGKVKEQQREQYRSEQRKYMPKPYLESANSYQVPTKEQLDQDKLNSEAIAQFEGVQKANAAEKARAQQQKAEEDRQASLWIKSNNPVIAGIGYTAGVVEGATNLGLGAVNALGGAATLAIGNYAGDSYFGEAARDVGTRAINAGAMSVVEAGQSIIGRGPIQTGGQTALEINNARNVEIAGDGVLGTATRGAQLTASTSLMLAGGVKPNTSLSSFTKKIIKPSLRTPIKSSTRTSKTYQQAKPVTFADSAPTKVRSIEDINPLEYDGNYTRLERKSRNARNKMLDEKLLNIDLTIPSSKPRITTEQFNQIQDLIQQGVPSNLATQSVLGRSSTLISSRVVTKAPAKPAIVSKTRTSRVKLPTKKSLPDVIDVTDPRNIRQVQNNLAHDLAGYVTPAKKNKFLSEFVEKSTPQSVSVDKQALLVARRKAAGTIGPLKKGTIPGGMVTPDNRMVFRSANTRTSTVQHELAHSFQNKTVGQKTDSFGKNKLKSTLMKQIESFVDDPQGLLSVTGGNKGTYSASQIKNLPHELLSTLMQHIDRVKGNKKAERMLKQLMKFHGYNRGGIVQHYGSGGSVYANNSALAPFLANGTDTVPAMLTPGEFVINREQSQKHAPLLHSINSGHFNRGGAVNYLANGGIVAPKYYANAGPVTTGNTGVSYDISSSISAAVGEAMKTAVGQLNNALQTGMETYSQMIQSSTETLNNFGQTFASASQTIANSATTWSETANQIPSTLTAEITGRQEIKLDAKSVQSHASAAGENAGHYAGAVTSQNVVAKYDRTQFEGNLNSAANNRPMRS